MLGVAFRLFISSNGNFIFNMDNARDMLDIREMVVLKQARLIGPTTSIDGVYFGPFWYWLLAVPFILTGGNPYGSILLEIILWAIGGYFLLSLVNKYYGKLALLAVSLVWIGSNYIILGSQYAFNPNPILFLTPVFVYSLLKFQETKRLKYSLYCWFLAGAFFHFSVPVGIFMPIVYILSLLWMDRKLLKNRTQIIGVFVFLITFLPQLLFDLRHHFFMSKNLVDYHSTSHGNISLAANLRFKYIKQSFYESLQPTLMNFNSYTNVIIVAFSGLIYYVASFKKPLDNLTKICLILLLLPLIGLVFIKIDILRWYLNETLVAAIFLLGFIIYYLQKFQMGRVISLILVIGLSSFSFKNISQYINMAMADNSGNSILRNEIKVIDLVYEKASGKNFKVYTYLPSVYDFPYQYLFWWYGLKKYDYLPEDFAYLPDKPQYVVGKDKINGGSHPESSGLIFLIKEPDQINQRDLWENSFKNLELLETNKVGVIEVETRKAKLQ